MKTCNLHVRHGVFTHFYPGGAPVLETINHSSSSDKVTISDPCERVQKLHSAFRLCQQSIPLDLEFEILEVAQELLKPEILLATITSGIVCDMTVDLLFDSLKLGICPEHERSTSVALLYTLTETHEPGSRLRPAVKCYEVPCDLDIDKRIKTSQFILNWSRKADGLRDLVLTMHALYIGKPSY